MILYHNIIRGLNKMHMTYEYWKMVENEKKNKVKSYELWK
jgi:hypothetical protein